MAETALFVCLANSYRPGGHCVAGKRLLAHGFGSWLRPVSARSTSELSNSECQYAGHIMPRLLDLIQLSILEATPSCHQTENAIIDASTQWTKLGALDPAALPALCDRPDTLWNLSESTRAGRYNCICSADAAKHSTSLYLIHVAELSVLLMDGGKDDMRAHYGSFHYNHVHYILRVTDPCVFADYMGHRPGLHPAGEAFLCISLSHAYEKDHRCHKLIAGVILKPRT